MARFKISRMLDMKDYRYFAEKGLAGATTTAPLPADPHEWPLNTSDQPQLRAARHRLAAKLAKGADSILPKTATGAQVNYDCWVEQQEEGGQPGDMAACGDQFNHTMAKLTPRKRRRALCFPLGSTWLDPRARNTVKTNGHQGDQPGGTAGHRSGA
jgi:hypothetical protein